MRIFGRKQDKPITLDQLSKKIDNLTEVLGVTSRKVTSSENTTNRMDSNLGVLNDIHLDLSKIHGELQTLVDSINKLVEIVKQNTKITEAAKIEVVEEITDKIDDLTIPEKK